MKHLKKSLSLFLCIVLCLSLFPFPAAYAEENIETVVEEETVSDVARSAAIHSGTWGNLTWTLPEESGLLTISGNGVMDDFASDSTEAWRRYRDYIKAVEIGSGVTSIGAFAFAYCYGIMTSVTIPESVTSIGAYAFDGCQSLTSVTIPASVTSIGGRAFSGCRSLTSVTIPEGVTSIEAFAFCQCRSLTSVTIPESVTSIRGYAFSYCDGLPNITIPERITSIAAGAFSGCSSLKEIRFCGAPPTIDNAAFTDVTATACYPADEGWTKGAMQNYGGKLTWVCSIYSGKWGNLKWTLSIESGLLTITGNGKMNDFAQKSTEAWREYKDKIKSVKIDSGVTNIGKFAFYDCRNITDVTIPEGVTIIDENAFNGCQSLTSVTIPESVTVIEVDAFNCCENLTSITFPEGVEYIGTDAFRCCINLMSVTIPNNIVRIESYAFSGCSSLKEIRFCDGPPEYLGYNSIRDNAFQGVTATAYYPANLYWSESDMQNYGGELTWVQYELESKEGNWGNLTWYLDLKTLVLTISGNGKMDDFASGSHESHGAWHNYAGVYKSVQINSGVTSIGERAFDNSSFLTSVTIPESVTSIGASAFDGCFSLTSVTIPENITSIGTYAFYYCKSLKEIRFLGAPPTIGDNAFKSVTATADYPANRGWTAGAMQNYGGNLTWMPFETAPDFILPTGLTVIEEEAFERGAFTYVKLSEITTKIGPRAFADCPNLRYIYIPEATTSIDPNAFGDLSTLTVFGKTGSTAEIFAQTHGFTFVAVP